MHILNHLLYDVQRRAQRVSLLTVSQESLPLRTAKNTFKCHFISLVSAVFCLCSGPQRGFLRCSFHTPLCDFVNGMKSFRAQ